MNPTDLRTELSARAAESEGHPYGDLLPGVQRKIRTTKRRRAATALAGTAAVAALALGVLPTITTTDTPDPAETPSDVVTNGVTFPGQVDGDRLQTAVAGRTGETKLSFDWTPASNRLTIRAVCSVTNTAERRVQISADGIDLTSVFCDGSTEPANSTTLQTTDALWTQLHPGTKTRVELTLVDSAGRVVTDPQAVIGVGLYRTADRVQADPMPSQQPPASPDDYVKDGIRYRAKIGGDTLSAARVGDPGEREFTFTFTFTPATGRLGLRTFCLAREPYEVNVTINGRPATGLSCGSQTTDAGYGGGAAPLPGADWPGIRVGQLNTATVRLTDRQRNPVTLANARIGLGIYLLGEQRIVEGDGDAAALNELEEYNGHLYRLGEVRTAAATARSVSIDTPGGTPFLVYFGSTNAGVANSRVQLAGLDGETPGFSGPDGAGTTRGVQPSRPAGKATVQVVEGKPTKGKLFVALYTPVR